MDTSESMKDSYGCVSKKSSFLRDLFRIKIQDPEEELSTLTNQSLASIGSRLNED